MSSSQYHLRTTYKGVSYLFALDATTEATMQLSGDLSKIPLVSGEEISDNFVKNPEKITFKGSLSDVKSSGSIFQGQGSEKEYVQTDKGIALRSTKQWINTLKELRANGTLFYVSFGELSGSDNWIITNLTINQNQKNGISYGTNETDPVCAYSLILTLERAKLASLLRIQEVRDPVLADGTVQSPDTALVTTRVDVNILTYGPAGLSVIPFGTREADPSEL